MSKRIVAYYDESESLELDAEGEQILAEHGIGSHELSVWAVKNFPVRSEHMMIWED